MLTVTLVVEVILVVEVTTYIVKVTLAEVGSFYSRYFGLLTS